RSRRRGGVRLRLRLCDDAPPALAAITLRTAARRHDLRRGPRGGSGALSHRPGARALRTAVERARVGAPGGGDHSDAPALEPRRARRGGREALGGATRATALAAHAAG